VDHVIAMGEHHLRRVLKSYADCLHRASKGGSHFFMSAPSASSAAVTVTCPIDADQPNRGDCCRAILARIVTRRDKDMTVARFRGGA
jgi:hypothetical protein